MTMALQMSNPNYDRVYGNKYDRSIGITEIAKLVRKDIKHAIKVGALPQLKASVRISRFAGGQSLSVYVKSFEHGVINPAFVKVQQDHPHDTKEWYWTPRFLPEAEQALKTLTAIVEAYNMDGSDVQSDYFCVNFYKTVDFDWDLTDSSRKAIEAQLAVEAEAAKPSAIDAAIAALGADDLARPQAPWNF